MNFLPSQANSDTVSEVSFVIHTVYRIISLDWKQEVSQMQFKSKIVFLLTDYKFVIGKAVIPQETIYA